jgi:hypothetical protein
MPAHIMHQTSSTMKKNDKITVNEELFIAGDKNNVIKFYSKNNDKIEKISISGSADSYKVEITKDGEKKEQTMTLDDVKSLINKNSNLKFAKQYLSDIKVGGSRKLSKKSSKKSSKK